MRGARGDVALMIGGVERRLCLTLGALAEIETAFACESFEELELRLRKMSASELTRVLAALLRGGGEDEAAATLSASGIRPGEAARAVAEAFRAGLAP